MNETTPPKTCSTKGDPNLTLGGSLGQSWSLDCETSYFESSETSSVCPSHFFNTSEGRRSMRTRSRRQIKKGNQTNRFSTIS